MKPLRRYVQEQIKKNPRFAQQLGEAEADVNLAIALAQLREQRGLTQRELAVRTGMKQPQIARLEKGAQLPNIATLWRILNVLGATLELGPDGHCRVRPLRKPTRVKARTLIHA